MKILYNFYELGAAETIEALNPGPDIGLSIV
jgi:hypothetical protein